MVFNLKKNRVWAESAHVIMYIGLTMAGSIVFCFFVGRFVDNWLGIKGIFTTIFIVFGALGGANAVYRQIMKMTEESTEEDKTHENH